MHDRFNNRYSFVKHGKFVTLVSLTLKQVFKDQIKVQRESIDDKNKGSETLTLTESSEKKGKFKSAIGKENSYSSKKRGNIDSAIRGEKRSEKVKRITKKKEDILNLKNI
jgi:hypothetical protein